MQTPIETLISRIREIEDQLERVFDERRKQLQYRLDRGRVIFEADIKRRHRDFQTRLLPYIRDIRPLVLLTAPFIYVLIFPLVLLDLLVTVYQTVCFPVYGIGKVKRHDFIAIDRHTLGYLNAIEKFNCIYCSYANGVLAYVREIASRSEQYWCPIKHARKIEGMHPRYHGFLDFGDAKAYQDQLEVLRQQLRDAQQTPQRH